jgi:tetratricopeptide (TPR) repeat protein
VFVGCQGHPLFSEIHMSARYAWLAIASALLVGCQSKTEAPRAAQSSAQVELPVIAEALKLASNGEVEQGIEALSAAIVTQATESRLYSARATLQHRAGLNEAALADLNRALELAPNDAQQLNNRGFVLLTLQRPAEAVADLEHALQIDPHMASASNNRGLVSLAQGKHRDAIVWFSRALAEQPDYLDALNNRGFAWMQLGRVENAYADLNQALRISPQYVNALHNRGLLKAQAGEREAAILDFTEAMLLDPLNPKYYEHRGETYRSLGKLEESVADEKKMAWLLQLQELNRAVAAQPRNVRAWVDRARHYFDYGHESQARADLAKAQAIDPHHPAAALFQARLQLANADYEAVLATTETVLESDQAQEAWSLRGDAFFGLGRYDDALECFTNAKRFDARMAEIYFRKSQALAAQGNTDAAKVQLELATQLDPDIEERLR